MRETGRCWNCSTLLSRSSRAGVEFDTCVSCGLSFVDGRHWEPIRGGEAKGVEAFPVTGGRSCCARGDEWVSDRRLGLIGRRCLSCGRVSLPTDALLSALRGRRGAVEKAASGEDLWTGSVSPRRRRRPAADAERDRVFAFLFAVPLELSDQVSPRPPIVLAVMSLCAAVFLALVVEPGLVAALALQVAELDWWTPVKLMTSILVHWDLWHLAGNMYFLYVFGRAVEEHLGSATVLGILAGGGVAGGLLYLVLHLGEEGWLAGASGAVSGVLGAYFVMFPARSVGLSLFFWVIKVPALIYLGLWFIYQIFAVGQPGGVAYEAHIGGFAAGALGGFLYRVRRGRSSAAVG